MGLSNKEISSEMKKTNNFKLMDMVEHASILLFVLSCPNKNQIFERNLIQFQQQKYSRCSFFVRT